MGDSGTSSVLTRYDPCDYDRFTKVKEPLRGTRYNTRDELIRALGRSIRNINKDGRADGVRRLPNIWQKNVLSVLEEKSISRFNRNHNVIVPPDLSRFPADPKLCSDTYYHYYYTYYYHYYYSYYYHYYYAYYYHYYYAYYYHY
ncbi:hypothetical protein ANN_01721 [Periplaneta americana]|uniref:Uncharacterized protein n=1 Tax=Periplaneta americana TaxID=6978 RepID=A0ABQ8TWQ2_PERAM|nr:hypothetical protein ANN_01721 [Periplaneta americana]